MTTRSTLHLSPPAGADPDLPKHAVFAECLERQLRRGQPGKRLPPMRSLMRAFGISQSTLDQALRRLEADGLIIRRRGSGIFIAPRRRRAAPRPAVGVLVSDLDDPFCALLVKGIERELAARRRLAVICNGQRQFQTELERLHSLRGNIDGAIINPTTTNVRNPDYVRYFTDLARHRPFPFLLVDIPIPSVPAAFIGFDNRAAFFDMAGVLAGSRARGRRIYYVGAPDCVVGAARLSGFKAGLQKHRIPGDALTVVPVALPIAAASMAVLDARRWEPPAILVAASPLLVPKLLAICAGLGWRLPDDVLIAAVVEENFRDAVPVPVAAWVKPSVRLGEYAAGLIQDLIDGRPGQRPRRLPLARAIPNTLRALLNL